MSALIHQMAAAVLLRWSPLLLDRVLEEVALPLEVATATEVCCVAAEVLLVPLPPLEALELQEEAVDSPVPTGTEDEEHFIPGVELLAAPASPVLLPLPAPAPTS